MLAKHEMFQKFGGGETSKQGHAVETTGALNEELLETSYNELEIYQD